MKEVWKDIVGFEDAYQVSNFWQGNEGWIAKWGK